MHPLPPFHHRRQEQQGLLDVRGQVVQIHDLRHARLGDVGQPDRFGDVGDLALADRPVESDGQGHEPGDARDAPRRDLLGWPGFLGHGLAARGRTVFFLQS